VAWGEVNVLSPNDRAKGLSSCSGIQTKGPFVPQTVSTPILIVTYLMQQKQSRLAKHNAKGRRRGFSVRNS